MGASTRYSFSRLKSPEHKTLDVSIQNKPPYSYTRDKRLRAKSIENGECQLCYVRQTLEHLFR